jgi:TolB-like protein/Tfp pilus assembly protein PilF
MGMMLLPTRVRVKIGRNPLSIALKPEIRSIQPDPRSVRAQLRRILASPEFAASDRMCRFLRLAVTETLAGKSDDLKEYRLGLEVFDRPESFDPGADPIVRVEARRLRAKLAKYYDTDGRYDDMLIELPKGGYVPLFSRREPVTAQPSASAANRIAVLPFADFTGTPAGTCFSDGLTWELIHGLTRIESLSVVAWNSAAQLRAEGMPDLAVIREKLQVQTVLVGSIRRSADRLRVVAQMIDTASGTYLWSETYERRVDDAADIQQEISEAIIATLRIRLGSAKSNRRASAAYNPEAYQLYLKGRGQWNQRTESSIREALESFRQAVAIDPQFAAAYAGIADAYAILAEYGLEHPARVTVQARAAAERALEIDPSLGEAHCSLGLLIALHEWKWEEAEGHFRRALDLNPGYATAHHWLACDFLPVSGRFEEAMREIEIALALDPLSPTISEGQAFLLILQRRYEEAETLVRALINDKPSYFRAYATLGRVLMQMRRNEEAIEMLEHATAHLGDPPTVLGALGQAYGRSGKLENAHRMLTRLETMRSVSYAPATCLALTCLGLGQIDQALTWLERGLDRREFNVVLMGIHPAYDDLRGDPRFKNLVARLGLPQ